MIDVEIAQVDAIECTLEPHDWAYARRHHAEIEAYWRKIAARKSALFDGRVLLLHRCSLRDGRFSGCCFETAFSRFLAWRELGFRDLSVRNFFGMAALRAADGAFLLGEMGAHTSSAGHVYFPAGTPDPSDLREGRVDLAASVMRELEEETGLQGQDVEVRPGWTLVNKGGRIAFMREIRLAETAETAVARIHANLAKQAEPELSRIHIVRSADEAAELDMPDFMLPYLRHAFAQPG